MLPSSSPYAAHWDLYPRSYVASRAPSRIIVDGNLDKPVWNRSNWGTSFVEIDNGDQLAAGETIFKALYDDEFLYIGAMLQPAPHLSTEAHCTRANEPIYHTDSDFEVFVDVEQSHHNYKELELNAIGTPWNLWLDKPYADGGLEHSARIANIGDPLYYEVRNQHIGTRILKGSLNTKSQGALWTAEMALSWDDVLANTTISSRPQYLRINFSRVERKGDTNWVWQPQVRWDVEERRFRGFVDMHMPDAWGYLILQNEETERSRSTFRDPLWPAKLTATTVYYALHGYHSQYGKYTNKLDDLVLPSEIIAPMQSVQIKCCAEPEKGFLVTVSMREGGVISIREDRYMWVVANPGETNLQSSQLEQTFDSTKI